MNPECLAYAKSAYYCLQPFRDFQASEASDLQFVSQELVFGPEIHQIYAVETQIGRVSSSQTDVLTLINTSVALAASAGQR